MVGGKTTEYDTKKREGATSVILWTGISVACSCVASGESFLPFICHALVVYVLLSVLSSTQGLPWSLWALIIHVWLGVVSAVHFKLPMDVDRL